MADFEKTTAWYLESLANLKTCFDSQDGNEPIPFWRRRSTINTAKREREARPTSTGNKQNNMLLLMWTQINLTRSLTRRFFRRFKIRATFATTLVRDLCPSGVVLLLCKNKKYEFSGHNFIDKQHAGKRRRDYPVFRRDRTHDF